MQQILYDRTKGDFGKVALLKITALIFIALCDTSQQCHFNKKL